MALSFWFLFFLCLIKKYIKQKERTKKKTEVLEVILYALPTFAIFPREGSGDTTDTTDTPPSV